MMYLPLLAALAPAAPAVAADPAVPVGKVLVTASVASRVPEQVDATPAAVSVIERVDLDRALARDLRDALRYEPGVSIESSPARFGAGNISIRGLEGNRVAMLVDGIRMPDAFRIGGFSNASRNPLDTGLLSRIEVLRGPSSALYGSDALAGVVSMSTLDPRDVLGRGDSAGGFGRAGYESRDRSWLASAAAATRGEAGEGLLAATYSRGRERDNPGDDESIGAARTAPNPQDTRTASVLAKWAGPLTGGGRWRITAEAFEREVATQVLSLNPLSPRTASLVADDRATRSRASVDAEWRGLGPVDVLTALAYWQESGTRQDTVEVRANTTAACLSASGSISCRREVRFTFEQEEIGATLIGESAFGAHRLVYGAEGSRADIEEMRDGRQVNLATGAVTNVVGTDIFPTHDFPRSRATRFGVFAQDEIAMGAATLVPALRYDRYAMKPLDDPLYAASNPGRAVASLEDSAWSPKLGALVPVSKHDTLTLQLSAGFRAPPYSEMNLGVSPMPLGYAVIANPDLGSERSRGIEAGIRGRREAFDYSLTAYRTDYDDLIVSRAPLPCPGDPRCVPGAPVTFQSQNVTRARIEGVEARIEARLAPAWTLRAGASWSRGDDRSKGVPLNAIDPAKIVAGLRWTPASTWGGELVVTHAARKTRIDTAAGTINATPAFTTVDLLAHAEPRKGVTVNAGIFNLFDAKYWLWSDVKATVNPGASFDRYTQPGRNAGVSLTVAF